MASTNAYYASTGVCQQIISQFLALPEFSVFKGAPYLMRVMLGTFQHESYWRPYFPHGSTFSTSGYTPGDSGAGTSAAQFLNSPEIIALAKQAQENPTVWATIYQNVLNDYNYPHSIGQVMGYYLYTNNDVFRGLPYKFQTGMINIGAARDPYSAGTLMDTTFAPASYDSNGAPIPTVAALNRAIYASMVIMATKYEIFLRAKNTPAQAITKAAGAYVGKGADLNGMTPELRIAQIFDGKSIIGPATAYIGPSGSGTMVASTGTTPSVANGAPPNSVSGASDCTT